MLSKSVNDFEDVRRSATYVDGPELFWAVTSRQREKFKCKVSITFLQWFFLEDAIVVKIKDGLIC